MKIVGEVVFLDFEGGFWGIVTENNVKYFPVNGIPDKFKKDHFKIEATIKPANTVTIQMWGRAVEVQKIKAIT